MRTIKKIVIHHSAISNNDLSPVKQIKSLRRSHEVKYNHPDSKGEQAQYHCAIDHTGNETRLREEESIGWHAGHLPTNNESLAVVLLGNFLYDDLTKDHKERLAIVIGDWVKRYNIKREDVLLHHEVGKTACPGFDRDALDPILDIVFNTANPFTTKKVATTPDWAEKDFNQLVDAVDLKSGWERQPNWAELSVVFGKLGLYKK